MNSDPDESQTRSPRWSAAASAIGYTDCRPCRYTLRLLAFGIVNALVSPRGTLRVRGRHRSPRCWRCCGRAALGRRWRSCLAACGRRRSWSPGPEGRMTRPGRRPGRPRSLRRRGANRCRRDHRRGRARLARLHGIVTDTDSSRRLRSSSASRRFWRSSSSSRSRRAPRPASRARRSRSACSCRCCSWAKGCCASLMSAPLFYGVAIRRSRQIVDGRATGGASRPTRVLPCADRPAVRADEPRRRHRLHVVRPRRIGHRDAGSSTRPSQRSSARCSSRRASIACCRSIFAPGSRGRSPRESSAGGATRWVIRIRGGEMRLDGMEPRAGDLVLELEEARPGLVRWRAVSDDSHMTHFLTGARRSCSGSRSTRHDASDLDAALPARPRSGVVLRTDGTLRRAARRRLSDRLGRHAMIDRRSATCSSARRRSTSPSC